MSCVNCNKDFEGNFCPTCGEKKYVSRITFTSIVNSFFSGFLNMDKGFLFNLKNLTLYPKTTITNYINGKRKGILNPISYCLIIIGIYLFLDTLIPRGKTISDLPKLDLYGAREIGVKLGYFIRSQMRYFWLCFAVYCAFFTRIFFRKYNFFEHLTINLFILGHASIISILSRFIYSREILFFNFLVYIYISVLLYKIFKNPKDKFGSVVLSCLCVFLSFLLFFFIPSIFIVLNNL